MDFSSLSRDQQEIVENGDGVVIVKAGPGTGKTKTLTSRVAWLILKKQIDPEKILALTFTERAAREMKERLIPVFDNLPQITTFHGFCHALLKNWGLKFTLIEEESRKKLIRKIIKYQKTGISPRELSDSISRLKNSGNHNQMSAELRRLIELYNKSLLQNKQLDFDDLILKTVTTLTEDQILKSGRLRRFAHVLVDEFQDSNDMQYRLIKLVIGKSKNLFVIGDPLQSIYGFRGGNAEIFNILKNDHADHKESFLKINYRSFSDIVAVSKKLFPGLVPIKPHSSSPGRVVLVETLNEYSEADWVVNYINNKIGGGELLGASDSGEVIDADFADFAVIYRTHALARVLEKKLAESGFPYQIVKEQSDLEGQRIKLLSIHAAKGLEFPYVIICGFEKGLIPYHTAFYQTDPEEEKRLLYVAMTRAKQELTLLYTRKRNKKSVKLSPFHNLIDSPRLKKITDPAIDVIIKNQQRRAVGKSQMGLF